MGIIKKPDGSNGSVDNYSKNENYDKYNLKTNSKILLLEKPFLVDHNKNEPSSSSNPPEPNLRWKGRLSYSSDGIFFKVRGIGSKVRSWFLILLSKTHTVPLVSQTCIFSLPVLQECDSFEYEHMNHVLIASDQFVTYPRMT